MKYLYQLKHFESIITKYMYLPSTSHYVIDGSSVPDFPYIQQLLTLVDMENTIMMKMFFSQNQNTNPFPSTKFDTHRYWGKRYYSRFSCLNDSALASPIRQFISDKSYSGSTKRNCQTQKIQPSESF